MAKTKIEWTQGPDVHLPLHWRTPRMIFVDSMSDLFHDKLTDDAIAQVYAVMVLAHWHTFQILTKRPERMQSLLDNVNFWDRVREWAKMIQCDWNIDHKRNQIAIASFEVPPKNIWQGVSIEDQRSADYSIPYLLNTPAYVRWLSAEPLLAETDITEYLWGPVTPCATCPKDIDCECGWKTRAELKESAIAWAVIGCESGPRARAGNVDHIRKFKKQLEAAGVPPFVKQLGAKVESIGITSPGEHWPASVKKKDTGRGTFRHLLADPKGGDMAEWPEDLRVRQYPTIGV